MSRRSMSRFVPTMKLVIAIQCQRGKPEWKRPKPREFHYLRDGGAGKPKPIANHVISPPKRGVFDKPVCNPEDRRTNQIDQSFEPDAHDCWLGLYAASSI